MLDVNLYLKIYSVILQLSITIHLHTCQGGGLTACVSIENCNAGWNNAYDILIMPFAQ